MRRVSVDIGGTFTDCFLVWDGKYVAAKALTTYQNLAHGFNHALKNAYEELGLTLDEVMTGVDSVRYATTLGTNALIERKGPKIGLITTAGFESSVPISRGRGYGEGLSDRLKRDLPMGERPDPLIPIPMIVGVRERVSESGEILLAINEDDLREKIRHLVDRGAQGFVVSLLNSVINPENEIIVEEIIREEYPSHMLGAFPVILSHLVVGRKGEYARTSSSILDAFLHQEMYHGLSSLELNLRDQGYDKPMQVIHNSGGMAQLNSTDALQTIHSGPVAGIHASEHLAMEADLGNIICTDMGGTSFDIGLVVEGGVKFYDFNPVIDRWMVNIPMVHLVTLGAGGGSIAKYDRMSKTVQVGPESARSDPGPACYNKGGMKPTVTDADFILGYIRADRYAGGSIELSEKRALSAMKRNIGKKLGISEIDAAIMVKQKADNNMANGIAQELRTRGYEPRHFTMLAYGGNGALHGCGIANILHINKILVPPFSSIFSAVGAGNMDQMHFHETSLYLTLFDTYSQDMFDDYDRFNVMVADLEEAGKNDLMRQGLDPDMIEHRLELDMRYGNQLAETTVICPFPRMTSEDDILDLIELFSRDYGQRFGEGSQSPEAGIRVNTIRVASYVSLDKVHLKDILPTVADLKEGPEGGEKHPCYFPDIEGAVDTVFHTYEDLEFGTVIPAPAVVSSDSTTFLVEPGWQLEVGKYGAGWLRRLSTKCEEGA
ncbi:MAG: hydantoinase [Alphaproteobacteria bacterium]|nr:MAG: hydantoinase [Alphaproteobacteria bacterium]